MTGRPDLAGGWDLAVDVATPPDPVQLRPAIAAVLAGRPWPDGPERAVADAVQRAVAAASGQRSGPRRTPDPSGP
jgi:hypothetical protein